MQIPIVKLAIPEQVITTVGEVLRSGRWADGSHVHQLEADFAKYCGTSYCRGVSNGTAALMTIMGALGLGPGDEVIVPSFSFIATANCVKSVGATPIFAEIDPITFNMDPEDVRSKMTSKTKAIMPVHLYGLCADMTAYQEICEEKDLYLIEDACQAHGAAIGENKSGSFGVAAAFSLYPTKNMFAGGEGGLITTNDEELYEKIKLYMNHGASKRYHHTALGFNFRMAEVNAVVAQYALDNLDQWNGKRQKNARYLNERLKNVTGLSTPTRPDNYNHVYHQYTLKINEIEKRNKLVAKFQAEKIGYGIHYAIPIHKQEYYQQNGYSSVVLPISQQICGQVISLPIHHLLTEGQLAFLADTILSVF